MDRLRLPPAWTTLFFVPSFYAAVTWALCYSLYELRLIEWHPSTGPTNWVVIWTTLAFVVATVVSWKSYGRTLAAFHALQEMKTGRDASRMAWFTSDKTLVALHIVGFIGLLLHVRSVIGLFGSLDVVIFLLLNESHFVRIAEVDALGIYVAYAGWIAIPLTALKWGGGGRLSWWLKAMIVFQFAGNLLFIDRTRPVWLVFVSMLVVAPFLPYRTFSSSLRWRMGALVVFGFAAFFAIGAWVGKTGEYLGNYGYVKVPYQFAGLYYYLTGSFAYLDQILEFGALPDEGLQRSLYPLYRFGYLIGLNDAPPSQILPFDDLPFPTNVATFLEPYFSDGGYGLMIGAVIVHAFGLNILGLYALRSWSPWGLFLWATFCFVSFISFFVPKLVSAPVWLFALVSAYAIYVRKVSSVVEEDLETLRVISRVR